MKWDVKSTQQYPSKAATISNPAEQMIHFATFDLVLTEQIS